MYPAAYVIPNWRPLKMSVQPLLTGKQLSPLQLSISQQYQTHPKKLYRCQNIMIRYPAPTSKDDQGKYKVTTSKGDLKQQTPVISKERQVAVNSKG